MNLKLTLISESRAHESSEREDDETLNHDLAENVNGTGETAYDSAEVQNEKTELSTVEKNTENAPNDEFPGFLLNYQIASMCCGMEA